MRPAILVLILALVGCSGISYHISDERSLESMAGYSVRGFSSWSPFGCDIYLLPVERYPSIDCYNAVIDHEEMHCREHHFHPLTPDGSFIVECQKVGKDQR